MKDTMAKERKAILNQPAKRQRAKSAMERRESTAASLTAALQ
jgi:hypothetical protein